MFNVVNIGGRITKDLELKKSASNVSIINFSIACERDFKDQNGEKVTDFFDVVAFRNTAEFVEKHFGKGRMIIVNGTLQTRSWTDKDGNKRKAVEIVANNVYFGDSQPKETAAKYAEYSTQNADFEVVEEDGDLPF